MNGAPALHAAASRTCKRRHGASRFELLIALLIIGVVATLLLQRLMHYQQYAERAVMEATVVNLRSGLRLRVAELMIEGRMAQMGELLHENPISWLQPPPANYVGVWHGADRKPGSGSWYFDAAQQQLVYLPQRRHFFGTDAIELPELRLQVMARSAGTAFTRTPGPNVEGLALLPVHPYRRD